MSSPRILVVTGATSGLGLRTVRALYRDPANSIIVGARHPERAATLRAMADRTRVLRLDTSSIASVAAFAELVLARIGPGALLDGLACNAGLQIFGDDMSTDGYELTFATNYLGHFHLTQLLLPRLAPGAAVISTASGTHDPNNRLARRFNFRGGLFTNARDVASGRMSATGNAMQRGRDRYATSKLCQILFTMEMARRVPPERARFIAFDPGLMPGTNLARQFPAPVRFAWKSILPTISRSWPGVSTAERSGHALARLLTEPALAAGTGLHIDFRLQQTEPSEDALRRDLASELFAFSEMATSKGERRTASALA